MNDSEIKISAPKMLFFSVVLGFLFLIFFECGARVIWSFRTKNKKWLTYGSETIGQSLRFNVDFYPGYYKLAPNPQEGPINSRGFRGPDFSTQKAEGTFRIVNLIQKNPKLLKTIGRTTLSKK